MSEASPVFLDPENPAPIALIVTDLAEPNHIGPYLETGASGSVGVRRLRDMPEIWEAGNGIYNVAVDADGRVTLVPVTVAAEQGYRHMQTANASVWTVSHGLGYHPAGIVIHDSAENIVIPHDVLYDSLDVLRIVFLYAFSGIAELS